MGEVGAMEGYGVRGEGREGGGGSEAGMGLDHVVLS